MSQTGQRLRTLRRRARLTQEQLARQADVTATTVARIELGMVDRPQHRTIVRLANALGVPITDLIDEDEEGDVEESAAQPA